MSKTDEQRVAELLVNAKKGFEELFRIERNLYNQRPTATQQKRRKSAYIKIARALSGEGGRSGVGLMMHAVRLNKRLQCKHLADDYLQRNSDENTSVLLDRVEFSPARHSCIAAVTRGKSGNRITLYEYEAVDLLTAETLFSGECNGNDANSRIFCGNGRDVQLLDKRDKALEAALKSID